MYMVIFTWKSSKTKNIHSAKLTALSWDSVIQANWVTAAAVDLRFFMFIPSPKLFHSRLWMKEWWGRSDSWSLHFGCRGCTSKGEEGQWFQSKQEEEPTFSLQVLLHAAVLFPFFPLLTCCWVLASTFSKTSSCLASWSHLSPNDVASTSSPWWLTIFSLSLSQRPYCPQAIVCMI